MKKILTFISIIAIISLCGCTNKTEQESDIVDEYTKLYENNDVTELMSDKNEDESIEIDGNSIMSEDQSNSNRYDELFDQLNQPIEENNAQEETSEDIDESVDGISDKVDYSSEVNTDTIQENDTEQSNSEENIDESDGEYYVSGVSNLKTYHSTPDCRRLATARNIQTISKSKITELGLSPCSKCISD